MRILLTAGVIADETQVWDHGGACVMWSEGESQGETEGNRVIELPSPGMRENAPTL